MKASKASKTVFARTLANNPCNLHATDGLNLTSARSQDKASDGKCSLRIAAHGSPDYADEAGKHPWKYTSYDNPCTIPPLNKL
jgi:hypothetical protein